tara:strand:+ start:603 stop:869 length:267 start_codon:yes stop_codon:yes gene_type:complete
MLKNTEEGVIVSYLEYRKIYNMGFLKYSNLSAIFCYILNNYDKEHIRKLFIKLVRNNHFIKKQNHSKKSYTYQFIPIEIWKMNQSVEH